MERLFIILYGKILYYLVWKDYLPFGMERLFTMWYGKRVQIIETMAQYVHEYKCVTLCKAAFT